MAYSKELREWASLIQSNITAAEALKARQSPAGGAGAHIRALMVEIGGPQGTPSKQLGAGDKAAEALWNEVDRRASVMGEVLDLIEQKPVQKVIDIDPEEL